MKPTTGCPYRCPACPWRPPASPRWLSPLPTHNQPLPPVMPIGKIVQIKTPLGLPPVPIPADNPPTEETIALGRRLYYDPLLSVDGTISCASCHAPQFAFSDNRPVSEGVGKKTGTRHAPTVINSAYYTRNSGMAALPAWKNKPKDPWPTPWKWLIPSTAW